MRPTDEQLLRQARQGDTAAFHELIDRHGENLFRLAYSLVGNRADAEDVAQETLMGAFEYMHGFEERSSVKTWLTRILMRQAARCHRRRGRKHEEPIGTPDAWADDAPPDESARRRMDVRGALDRLSPDHREVVVLREFEGMSYSEMAEALDVPQGTVESRLYRARQELKTLLRDYLPPQADRGGS
ncbi:MAG: RNA polymerase sigma factor [Candidatus Brocadiia bacterium]